MRKYFGTDGIRAKPWSFPFTKNFLEKIGYSITKILFEEKKEKVIFIARDTRQSGIKIKQYLINGFSCFPVKIIDLGIITTPMLSFLSKKYNVLFGVMISASHNPAEFNGIKFFSSSGEKLKDDLELKIEELLDKEFILPKKRKIKILKKDYKKEYADFIISSLPDKNIFKDLKIVLDCANGGAYQIAPYIFRKLKTKLTLIGNNPNGKNINYKCGALYTDLMRKRVLKEKAYAGVSLDGDADRAILSDEKGMIFDGDDIIALLTYYFKNNKSLNKNSVVLTVMSNYGLISYLKKQKINLIEVSVGDKNVSDALNKFNLSLGGETSGHIIIKKFLPTGDGILSSIWAIYSSLILNKKLSYIKDLWIRYPQKLHALKVEEKINLNSIVGLKELIKEKENKIKGRIFVRYSGTEPVLRVLTEGLNEKHVDNASKEIISFLEEYFKNKKR